MMVYSSTISEILTHVYDKIAGQLSRKIISDMGLTEYLGNRIYIRSDYLGPSKSTSERRLPILHENAFQCNIKYSLNPFGIKWDSTTPGQHMDPAIHRRDTMNTAPLFYDPKHCVQIIERSMPCNITLDCSFNFTDKVVAFDVASRFLSTYVRGELMSTNNLYYQYKFPLDILSKLYTIGQLIGIPKGQYYNWLQACSNNQIQRIISKRERNRTAELVVEKHMWDTLTAYDYDMDNFAVSSLGTSMNTVALPFTAVLQFSRINLLYLKYPIVINNHLVPDNLVTVDRMEAFGRSIRYIQHPWLVANPYYQEYKCLINQPARNPWYDNWTLPLYTHHEAVDARPFFIGVVTLDLPTDPCAPDDDSGYTEVNLDTDMDKYKIADEVIAYYKEHKSECLHVDSEYSVSVFSGDTQVDPCLLEFDGTVLRIPHNTCKSGIFRLVLCNAPKKGTPAYYNWFINNLIFTIEPTKE